MKVGSIVRLENDRWATRSTEVYKPVKERDYTVRGFCPYWGFGGLLLEEIINPIHSCGLEPSFITGRFVEILPPIANIEERINANVLTEEVVCRY